MFEMITTLKSILDQFFSDIRGFNTKMVNYMDTLTSQIVRISDTFKGIRTDLSTALV